MKLTFDCSKVQNQKFETFFDMLIETNKLFNLTAITDENEVIEKHFFDSIQLADLMPNNSSIIDVGAGAGFPSIPLKIMNESLNITMIDSLTKRINFLDEVCKKLSFNNYICAHSRAEDYAQKFREQFDCGIARAVAPLPTLCELVAPFVKVGGKLLLMKGSNYLAELDISKNAFKELGLKLSSIKKYVLPNCKQERVIIILDKIVSTPKKYPRNQNKPKLLPL